MANLAMKDQSERKVEVDRKKLVETLKTNREKHIANYKEAIDGYKEMALAKLTEGYEDAKVKLEKNREKAESFLKDFDPSKPGDYRDYLTLVDAVQVHLTVPRDFSKQYDAAIDMANWDVRENLELTHAEFQCFVRDVWDWSSDFERSTIMYMKAFK